ncbi:MAG: D-isomer specific 2-hydroxyacid dehydrogenase family protein, partial [Rhodococcus sp. (in: high G+C Gram-positive bacteria)]
GGVLAPLDDAEAVVWAQGPDTFPAELPDSVRWVQLPSAGVEPWISAGIVDTDRAWTSAAGAYAGNVAEHAVLLLLAGVRALTEQVRATSWRKAEFDPQVGTLRGATVAIVGCGGIGRAMIPLLAAFGADVLAVTRSGTPVPGASETLPADRTSEIWSRADHFVIAAPATSATAHLVDETALAQMTSTAWIVNVARGSLIDTEGLVRALRAGSIGGAALDVTDPEPLPDGHPLWTLPNAIVTPHVANPATGLTGLLADHVATNVERFAAGAPLLAPIDPVRGY